MCVCVCVRVSVYVCVCVRVCVCVTEDGGCAEWPAACQAVFSAGDEDTDVDSTLTWAYPEPRLITSITTLPVPLGLHNARSSDHSTTVSLQSFTRMFAHHFDNNVCPSLVERN